MTDPKKYEYDPTNPPEALPVEPDHTHLSATDATDSENQVAQEPLRFLQPPTQPGEIGRLGHYRVLRELGRGGMGVVLQARDPQLNRLVALKVMRPDLTNTPLAVERFLREARAAAAVKHDHIITIYQVGQDRGVPFIALEFLDGETLDARLKRDGILPPHEVARIGHEIALGLAAAHANGLIHRDIKPANIWLEAPNARVKILDFGLARAAKEDVHLTGSGAVVGTPAYMSPEQANGDPVDHRSDLFSMGVVLYRLATGVSPFKGDSTLAILTQLATHTPTAPHILNSNVPILLSQTIMQLLAKPAEQRFQSARAVAQALAPAAKTLSIIVEALPAELEHSVFEFDESSVEVKRPSKPVGHEVENKPKSKPSGKRAAHRQRVLVPVISACACFLLALVAWQLFQHIRSRTPQDRSPDSSIAAVKPKDTPKPDPAPVPAPLPPIAMSPVVNGPSPLDLLDATKIPASERFPWQPKELVAVVGTHAQRYWYGGGPALIVMNPKGEQCVSLGDDGLRFWDLKTGRELAWERGRVKLNAHALAYSPDGTRLSVYSTQAAGLVLYDVTVMPPKEVCVVPNIYPAFQPFTADGKHVIGRDQKLAPHRYEIWDISGDQPKLAKTVPVISAGNLPAAAGTQRLIHIEYRTEMKPLVQLVDFSKDQPSIDQIELESGHWAVSPDGRWFVNTEEKLTQARVYDISSGKFVAQEPFKHDLPDSQILNLCFIAGQPDELFYADGGLWVGRVRNLRTGKVRKFEQPRWQFGIFAFDPTLQHLLQFGHGWYPRLEFQTINTEGTITVRDQTGVSCAPAVAPYAAALVTWEAAFKPPTRWRLNASEPQALSLKQSHLHFHVAPHSVLPDGRVVGFSNQPGTLAIIDPSKGDAAAPTLIPGNFTAPYTRWTTSPTGRYLLVCPPEGDTRPQVFDVTGQEPKWILTFPDRPAANNAKGMPQYSPSEQFAIVNMTLYDLRGPKPKAVGNFDTPEVTFALDQPLIVGRYSTGIIKIFNYGSGTLKEKDTITLQPFTVAVAGAVLLPNSQTLLASDVDGHIKFIKLPTGEVEREWTQWPGGTNFLLAPDGRHVYAVNSNGTCYVLRMQAQAASPLDALDATKIPASERFPWQPKELVAVVGTHAYRTWGTLQRITYSPKGDLIATMSTDGVRLWETVNFTETAHLPEAYSPESLTLQFSPDGKYLSFYDTKGTVFYDVSQSPPRKAFRIASGVNRGYAVSPDGTKVVLDPTGVATSAEVWDITQPQPKRLAAFPMPSNQLTNAPLAWTADGHILSLHDGGKGMQAVIWSWEVDKATVLARYQLPSQITALSSDGKRFATTNAEGKQLLVFDITGGQFTKVDTCDTETPVTLLKFLPDSKTLMFSDAVAWRYRDVHQKTTKSYIPETILSHGSSVGLSPNGDRMVTQAGNSKGFHVYRLEANGKAVVERSSGIIQDALPIPESNCFTTCDAGDSPARRWDLNGPIPVLLQRNLLRSGRGLIALPDGRMVGAGLAILDPKLGDAVAPIVLPGGPYSDMYTSAVSRSGRYLFAAMNGADRIPRLFDMQAQPPMFTRLSEVGPNGGIYCAWFTPNEQFVAALASAENTLHVWDLRGLKPKRINTLQARMASFAVDSATLVTGGPDGKLTVYDYTTGVFKQTVAWQSFTTLICGVVLLPGGQTIMACDAQGQFKFINVTTGKVEREWKWPGPALLWLAPDGRHVYTQNANGTGYILRFGPDKERMLSTPERSPKQAKP